MSFGHFLLETVLFFKKGVFSTKEERSLGATKGKGLGDNPGSDFFDRGPWLCKERENTGDLGWNLSLSEEFWGNLSIFSREIVNKGGGFF